MRISRIAYEERVARLAEGSASDPGFGVPVLMELSAMTLRGYMGNRRDGGSARQLKRVVDCLRGEGIGVGSTLGEAVGAIDRSWDRSLKSRPACWEAVIALADRLAGMSGSAANRSNGGSPSRPSSAPLGAGVPVHPMSYEQRVSVITGSCSHVVNQVAQMSYVAYLEAIGTATGFDAPKAKATIERYWEVGPGYNVKSLMAHACNHAYRDSTSLLLATLLVEPIAALNSAGTDLVPAHRNGDSRHVN